jgi:uncharacterized membrane protein YhhN
MWDMRHDDEMTGLLEVMQPVLMVVLGCWLVWVRRRTWGRPVTWMLAGILFGLLAGVLRTGGSETAFTASIACFLLMDSAYVMAFTRVPGAGLIRAWKIAAVPYVLLWITLLAIILPNAGGMRLAVLVSITGVMVMALAALDLVIRLPQRYSWWIVIGAGCLIVPVVLTALARIDVIASSNALDVIVLITFAAAQSLIVVGFERGQAVAASRSR